MKIQLITINSNSTGTFTNEIINNRAHIVTKMVSIEGDTVMNGLFYPFAQIVNSRHQLNNLIAPAGHPEVDGEKVSAFDPTAINSFNIGAFVRNPVMQGNKVINELVIDIETAEKTEDGKELVNRVKAGDQIAVSTGLKAKLINRSGEHEGKAFKSVVDGIQFDHVAILLNEKPAGENTFTINSGAENEETVIVCNITSTVSELQSELRKKIKERIGDDFFIEEIFLSPQRAIAKDFNSDDFIEFPFSYDELGNLVLGEGKEVDKITIFNKGDKMKKNLLVMALIANINNAFSDDDKDKLMAMDELELVNAASKPLSFDDAKVLIESKGFHVNKIDDESAKVYLENKDSFQAFKTTEDKKLEDMADHIASNSKFEKDELLEMGIEGMEKINNMLDPKQSYEVQGAVSVQNKSDKIQLHEEA